MATIGSIGFGTANSLEMFSVSLDPFEVGVCLAVAAGVFIFVKLRRPDTDHLHLPLREFVKGHNFVPTDLFAYPSYCNVCEENVVEGFSCDACGVVSHPRCAHTAHRQIRCKALSSFGPVMKHHLMKGIFVIFTSLTNKQHVVSSTSIAW